MANYINEHRPRDFVDGPPAITIIFSSLLRRWQPWLLFIDKSPIAVQDIPLTAAGTHVLHRIRVVPATWQRLRSRDNLSQNWYTRFIDPGEIKGWADSSQLAQISCSRILRSEQKLVADSNRAGFASRPWAEHATTAPLPPIFPPQSLGSLFLSHHHVTSG